MNHIFLLSSAEARRLWECLMDPPAVHLLWENLVTLLCDLFSVERCNLFLVIPESQQLRSRAATCFSWDIELPWDQGIAGQVYQEKTPLLINDIPNSEYSHYFNKDPKGFKTESMLTVPVFREGNENQPIVAIIQLVNKLGVGFSAEDIEALKYWSRQIGVSLERTHGTEIWRHPESEPPFLEDPNFDPVLPNLAMKKASLALPGFVNLLVSELSNNDLQMRKLTWSKSFWESRELINIVRNGHRHARIAHQLSGEPTQMEKRLGRAHRHFVRLVRWVCATTRNNLLCNTLTAFEAWLSFYASAFAYWLAQEHPRERNLLYTLVEDKRSHCIFYESLLLDYLIHHPGRTAEFRIYKRLFQIFYSYFARHMVDTMSHVTKRRDLPILFSTRFTAFNEHRSYNLWERAQARSKIKQSAFRRFMRFSLGCISLIIHGLITMLITPLALLWPIRGRPDLEEEIPGLLEQTKAA